MGMFDDFVHVILAPIFSTAFLLPLLRLWVTRLLDGVDISDAVLWADETNTSR